MSQKCFSHRHARRQCVDKMRVWVSCLYNMRFAVLVFEEFGAGAIATLCAAFDREGAATSATFE